MNPHTHKIEFLFAFLLALVFVGSANAQTPARISGELIAAKGASINGAGAISGQTIFNTNRVKTGLRGQAVISLGRRGRMEIGSDTDLTMNLQAVNIGGDLKTGSLKLSVPMGVSISVGTPKGLVTTDGLNPAVISIEIEKDTTRVTTLLGESRVVANGRVERVTTGEEVAVNNSGWKRRYVTTGIAAAGSALAAASLGNAAQTAGRTVPQAVNNSRAPGVFADLFNNSVNFTFNRLANGNRGIDPDRFFDTTITCRDHDNVACRRRSGVNP